ncbi:hypothetical protein [Chitinivibrio alkaliphilus]|uniref:Uncharacterized protein n=1 Tax=Chitinivibrio alkaliphilus ACht1 TaxID=1313304 RepID=U7D7A0_9BACT|nr:hypothetical protein [Chitinivibrio alkaliphilus]ERP31818.1 hypothetical protein CALK_1265 [Chitinivibrio alkaliphilus ACht1]
MKIVTMIRIMMAFVFALILLPERVLAGEKTLSFTRFNRFVGEGIDEGVGPVHVTHGEVEFGDFAAEVEWLSGESVNFNEIVMGLFYTLPMLPWDATFGGAAIGVHEDDDWEDLEVELFIENSLELPAGFGLSHMIFFNSGEEAFFSEFLLEGDLPVAPEAVEIAPFILLGVDHGLVDEDNGFTVNHMEFGADFTYEIGETSLFLFNGVSGIVPLKGLSDLDEDDAHMVYHMGLGFSL